MRLKHVPGQLLTLAALLMILGCAPGADKQRAPTPPRWTSRATPAAKGEVKEIDGEIDDDPDHSTRIYVRY